MTSSNIEGNGVEAVLLGDLRTLIEEARQHAATTVNRTLVMLYWRVGRRIHADVLQNVRADYGKAIVVTLSRQLVPAYGRGFSKANLHRMVQFARVFSEEGIVVIENI